MRFFWPGKLINQVRAAPLIDQPDWDILKSDASIYFRLKELFCEKNYFFT